MIEIIIATLSSSALTTIVTTLVNRRTMRIENDKQIEAFWKDRIDHLVDRIDKLEKLACYDRDCKKRL